MLWWSLCCQVDSSVYVNLDFAKPTHGYPDVEFVSTPPDVWVDFTYAGECLCARVFWGVRGREARPAIASLCLWP